MKTYFVYAYKFSDGGIYIGRSNENSNRFGNIECYKNQYVYSKMKEDPDFECIKVYGDNNIFVIYQLEAALIRHFKDKLGSKCYNGDDGNGWYQAALRDLSNDREGHKMSDLVEWINEFKSVVAMAIVMSINFLEGRSIDLI